MINNVTLVGRLTKDLELRKTTTDKSVTSFTIAIDNNYQKDTADFINCVVWNQGAEFLTKYAAKGDMVGVLGRLQTRTYDNQKGEKVYVTEVAAERVNIISKVEKKDEEFTKVDLDKMFDEATSEKKKKMSDVTLDIKPDELPFY